MSDLPDKPAEPNMEVPMLPAMATNFFTVQATVKEVKITFGQQFLKGGPVAFFQAITMSHTDARWLADLIEKKIADEEVGI